MMYPLNALPPRAIELLCYRALEGLDDAEGAELDHLLSGGNDDWSFELAAAAIDLSQGVAGQIELPNGGVVRPARCR